MKFARNLYTLAASLLLAASAFAGPAGDNKGTLRLYDTVTVQGKQLPAGEYRLEWSGTGPNVQVNVVKGKETVTTLQARVVQAPAKNATDGYSAQKEADGSSALTAIFFHGRNYELQIGEQAAAAPQAGGESGKN